MKEEQPQGAESADRQADNNHHPKDSDLQAEHPAPTGNQQVNEQEK